MKKPAAPPQTTVEIRNTGVKLPRIVFGSSCLGNLYESLDIRTKMTIMRRWFAFSAPITAIDTAGKYGAGLALEAVGRGLRYHAIPRARVVISNKLGWLRVPLRSRDPTFEKGVWKNIRHDAVQRLGYDGILACWQQGCKLLGGIQPDLVSVHDPDEYLAAAAGPREKRQRWRDISESYEALAELKANGEAKAIGVGAKDWRIIRELAEKIDFDWVMLACSLTVYRHPPELLAFLSELAKRQVTVINSAVFHAGFLTGGDYFDYRKVCRDNPEHKSLFAWRDRFFAICRHYRVKPAQVCVQFSFSAPAVAAVALNTSQPRRVRENVALVEKPVPASFWAAMKAEGLLSPSYPGLG